MRWSGRWEKLAGVLEQGPAHGDQGLAGGGEEAAALVHLVLEPSRPHQKLVHGQVLGRLSPRLTAFVEAEASLLGAEQGEQGLAAAQPLPAGGDQLSLSELDSPRAAGAAHPEVSTLAYLPEVLEHGPERMPGEVPLQELEAGHPAAEQALHPDLQLFEVEGAGQVFVGACAKSRHPLGRIGVVGEHSHADGPGARPAAQRRHRHERSQRGQIENHQVRMALVSRLGHPIGAAEDLDLMAGHAQPIFEHGREDRVLLDHQNLGHGHLARFRAILSVRNGGGARRVQLDREVPGKVPEVPIRGQDRYPMAFGDGTEEKVCVQPLDALGSAQVEEFGRPLMVGRHEGEVREGAQVVPQPVELSGLANPGENLLANRTDEASARLPDKVAKLWDHRVRHRLPAAEGQGPDAGVDQHAHLRRRCSL